MSFVTLLALLSCLLATQDSPKVSIEPRAKPTPAVPPASKSNIRVDTTVVLIPVTVTDPINRVVTGLEKKDFRIFEDSVEQEILHFAVEDAPLSIGLIFDTSGSMGAKLEKSRRAVAQFFKAANPEDEFFLVEFNDRPALVSGFTTSLEEIQNKLTFTQPKGRTALLDAIYMGLDYVKKGKNARKSLLIISDGGDNSSRYTESEIKNRVREADTQIYAIGILETIGHRSRTPEELAGPGLLQQISDQTGGRAFAVENMAELPDVAAKIGDELRNQYVLGYTPTNRERNGKYRRVQVKLGQPRGMHQLKVAWRQGYYAPAQ
jgi:Ca-activated chloride channel family protein